MQEGRAPIERSAPAPLRSAREPTQELRSDPRAFPELDVEG